jgi:5,10-methylenetetrahydromethanopterin reductase
VPSHRHVMVNAAGIATLAGLAPGRVAVAIGTAAGRRMVGQPPLKWREVIPYLETLRLLLQGKEVEWEGATIGMLHPQGFAGSLPLDIPFLVAAEGPRGVEVARRHGDGVFAIGQPKSGFEWSAVLVFGTVLPDEGRPEESQVLSAAGPGAIGKYHLTYLLGGAAVDALPGGAAWRSHVEAVPHERRHLALMAQHLVGLTEEDRAVLTPALAAEFTLTGTPDVLRERVSALETQGATEIVYQPAGPDIPGELRRFAQMAGLG